MRYLVLCLILIVCLASCRQSQQLPQKNAAITIELKASPEPPIPGDSSFVITLVDDAGHPINDAHVDVRGDMTHAGMQPVFATIDTPTDDHYTVPFHWSMGGDWVITVTVTRANGETSEKTFNFTVASS